MSGPRYPCALNDLDVPAPGVIEKLPFPGWNFGLAGQFCLGILKFANLWTLVHREQADTTPIFAGGN
jgi:hypothetical protein